MLASITMATNQPPPNYGFSDQPGGAPGYPGGVPGGYPGGAPQQPQGNGMAVAGLVLGIISIVLFFLSWIDAIIGILAIIFGAIGMSKANKIGGKGKGMAMAGLICGVIGVIISIAITVWALKQFNRRGRFGEIAPPALHQQHAELPVPAPLANV